MMQLFDKQVQLRMGQANVRRWSRRHPAAAHRRGRPARRRAFATHHLPLDEAPEAYEKFQEKDDGMVKVVFRP